ncbi:MAG: di-trans,poly-cis-decaprenylcistransferase, partial [Firmicutes bacterium]|nr:di-trans,poly-cis-decaprenylcistransferase [Bacillota bacterium]
MLNKDRMPVHVAVIMDGNGRWAKEKGVPRLVGHNAGMQAMKKIVDHSDKLGIKHLTVYAFSTENWKRSMEEVSGIFKLLVKWVASDLKGLIDNNVRVKV